MDEECFRLFTNNPVCDSSGAYAHVIGKKAKSFKLKDGKDIPISLSACSTIQ